MYRSRRLLGVRSSDWYRWRAAFLYFYLVCSVFFSEHKICHEKTENQLPRNDPLFSMTDPAPRGKMSDPGAPPAVRACPPVLGVCSQVPGTGPRALGWCQDCYFREIRHDPLFLVSLESQNEYLTHLARGISTDRGTVIDGCAVKFAAPSGQWFHSRSPCSS